MRKLIEWVKVTYSNWQYNRKLRERVVLRLTSGDNSLYFEGRLGEARGFFALFKWRKEE